VTYFDLVMADFTDPGFTRYVAVHERPNGAGDARPTGLQIVKDENLEGSYDSTIVSHTSNTNYPGQLTGKTILITGCSSGIGIETARALQATGAHIFCTARDLAKGRSALSSILEPGKLDLLPLDLNSLASVRAFAPAFLAASNNQLNVLVSNAGVMATPEGTTEDGFETQFGTNHLAHFLLFQLLKPALLASSTPEMHSRVVVLSSMGHRTAPIDFANVMLTGGSYNPWRAYAHSKTANIYMANEIERRYGAQGLHAVSLHPGGISTGLQVHHRDMMAAMSNKPEVVRYVKSVEQGCATTVWAAVAKCWEGKGGRYLEDCQISPPVPEGYQTLDRGYQKWAFDAENENRLWKLSNDLVGFGED
jgi:NAD(P)-dependent dehydrogenase (short-subunit alcohol dehydrogenase family)